MPLFEVAILETPTPKQAEDGAGEKLVLEPVAVVARDGQSAAMLVAVNHRAELDGINPDRMTVLVRPFA